MGPTCCSMLAVHVPTCVLLVFVFSSSEFFLKTREKNAKFIGEFRKALPYALSDIIFSGNDDAKKVVNRLISIWEERQLFYPDVKDLRAEFIGGNGPRNFVIYKPKQPTPDRLECDDNLGNENNHVHAAELQGQECLQRDRKRKFKAVMSQISKMELELSKLRSLVQELENSEEIPPPPPASTYPEPPPPPNYPPESPKATATQLAGGSYSHDGNKRARLDSNIQSQHHLASPLPPPPPPISSAPMPLPQFTYTPSVTDGFSMFTAPPYPVPIHPSTLQAAPIPRAINTNTFRARPYPGYTNPSTFQPLGFK